MEGTSSMRHLFSVYAHDLPDKWETEHHSSASARYMDMPVRPPTRFLSAYIEGRKIVAEPRVIRMLFPVVA